MPTGGVTTILAAAELGCGGRYTYSLNTQGYELYSIYSDMLAGEANAGRDVYVNVYYGTDTPVRVYTRSNSSGSQERLFTSILTEDQIKSITKITVSAYAGRDPQGGTVMVDDPRGATSYARSLGFWAGKLRGSGSNETMALVKIYGKICKWMSIE